MLAISLTSSMILPMPARPDVRVLNAVHSAMMKAGFIGDQVGILGVTFGAGNDQGMRRCSQHRVDSIDFRTAGAATENAEVADYFVVANALEYETGPWFEARLLAFVEA